MDNKTLKGFDPENRLMPYDKADKIKFDSSYVNKLYPNFDSETPNDLDFNDNLKLALEFVKSHEKYSVIFNDTENPGNRNVNKELILNIFKDIKKVVKNAKYSDIFEIIFHIFAYPYDKIYESLPDYIKTDILRELSETNPIAKKNTNILF